MPLYTYQCPNCGPMDMLVALADIDKPITCPICEYNRSVMGVDSPPSFEDWTTESWEKSPDQADGHVFLTKLIDPPARIRII